MNIKKVRRNGAISGIKLLFCMIIIMMHYNIPSEFGEYMFEGGYLYVDFFFILQGFYLIKDWNCEKEKKAFDYAESYLINRLRRFFPCVFAAALLMLILESIINCRDIEIVVKSASAFLWQISFISQFFDFAALEVGGILWFLSASIIIGTLIVWVCKRIGKSFIIIIPFVISLIINYLYTNIGNMDIWGTLLPGVSIRASLIRALMDVLIGVMAKGIYEYVQKIEFKKWVYYFEIIMSLLITVGSVYAVLYKPHGKMDFYLLMAFGLLLIMLSDSMNGVSFAATDLMDKICMPMYIFQVCSILTVNTFIVTEERSWLGLLIVLFIDLGLSIIWIKYFSKINFRNIFVKN